MVGLNRSLNNQFNGMTYRFIGSQLYGGKLESLYYDIWTQLRDELEITIVWGIIL